MQLLCDNIFVLLELEKIHVDCYVSRNIVFFAKLCWRVKLSFHHLLFDQPHNPAFKTLDTEKET